MAGMIKVGPGQPRNDAMMRRSIFDVAAAAWSSFNRRWEAGRGGAQPGRPATVTVRRLT